MFTVASTLSQSGLPGPSRADTAQAPRRVSLGNRSKDVCVGSGRKCAWGQALALLDGGVGGCLLPVAGPGCLYSTVHTVKQLPLLIHVPLVLPEEATSPQGVPH